MNEWSVFFLHNGWIQDGRIEDGCHHEVEWEWMNEVFFCSKWLNPRWQNSRWLTSQINQIELVGVRFRVEWECFWVNLREDNKVSESKMALSDSNIEEFKMAAIIKFSQNEWVKFFFVQMVGTNLGKCESVWEEILRWLNPRWQNSKWQNSRWLPSSS